MKIAQTVFGVFHHFELARELDRRGHLDTIYSTWPWARLKREELPQTKVKTFPWLHTPEMLLRRAHLLPHWLDDELGYCNALLFDEWTSRLIQPCDALIAISGSSLKAGRLVQSRGGKFICDRGSTHQRFQERLVSDEYRRWGSSAEVSDIRDTLREEEIYDTADAITVPSTAAMRSFVASGIPESKMHVIPYGVRLEKFFKTGDPPQDSFQVLFVGGVSLRKGIPYLLKAFAALQHPNKHLTIVGAVQPELAKILPNLPTDNVRFLGALPQTEITTYMSRSHVMVLPSVEEGLALVQGQAMACGCPVLATEATGAEDLFTDGVEGFIVPIREVAPLTERMQQLADDPQLQQRMSAAAIERVKSLGGWNRYGDMWEALLKQLTGKR